MTQQEARALVRKECRKRGRKYGANNARALLAMKAEVAFLKELPTRYARAMTHAYGRKRHVGDGCFVTGRCGTNWEVAD